MRWGHEYYFYRRSYKVGFQAYCLHAQDIELRKTVIKPTEQTIQRLEWRFLYDHFSSQADGKQNTGCAL